MSPFLFICKLVKKLIGLHSIRARVLLLLFFSILFLFTYRVLTISRAQIITLQEIPHNLVPAISRLASDDKQLCDIMPSLIDGTWHLKNSNLSDNYLENTALQNNIQSGGAWKPSTCIAQHHVALVVPYRDRQAQLNIFLAHMHPFLQFQHISYQIFIIEQTDKRPFNRAKLFNVGFQEAEKVSSFHCYIFHDVDLLPLNSNNIYGCTKLPRHLSAHIDIFDYKLPYDYIFGGAISILKSQFLRVNGFSNKFFGWGGEDDDFYNRVTRNRTKICRFEPEISKYIMLSHKKETPNEDRYYYLSTGERRFETDGLNSLKYTVQRFELLPLYTRILVDL